MQVRSDTWKINGILDLSSSTNVIFKMIQINSKSEDKYYKVMKNI